MSVHDPLSPTLTSTTMMEPAYGIRPQPWEYLVVYVEKQRGSWYEYWANGRKIDGLDNKPIHYVMNMLGSKGWELVNITPAGDYYFKRPRT